MLTNLFTVFPTVQKGQDNIFEIDVNLLLTDVQANKDSYFHNINVWGRVMVTYDTDQGGQTEHIEFNPARNPSSGSFTISSEARDIWEVQAVTIVDKDGGSIVYYRDELDTAYFDLDLSGVVQPPQPSTGAFSPTLKSNTLSLTNNNLTVSKTDTNAALESSCAYLDSAQQVLFDETKAYYCEFEINQFDSYSMFLGFIVNTGGVEPTVFDQSQAGGEVGLVGGNGNKFQIFIDNQAQQLEVTSDTGGIFDQNVTMNLALPLQVGDRIGITVDFELTSSLGKGLVVYVNDNEVGTVDNVQVLLDENTNNYIRFGASIYTADDQPSIEGGKITKVDSPLNPPPNVNLV